MTRFPSLLSLAILWVHVGALAAQDLPRRPVALTLVDAGETLMAVNRDSGTLSLVDLVDNKVLSEIAVGSRLSDAAYGLDARTILATDEKNGELLAIRKKAGKWAPTHRVKVAASPVSVIVTDHNVISVASLWGRRIQTFTWNPDANPPFVPYAVFDLAFAPRLQLSLPGTDKVVVADAFGGKIAVLDLTKKKVESVRSLANHNFRGLVLDRTGKNVFVTHQLLHAQGHANPGEIQSGSLLSNSLRKIPISVLLDPRIDLLGNDQVFSLGDVEQGAGDPGGLVETADGRIAVAISGTREVFIGRPQEVLWTRLSVGIKPTALLHVPASQRVYVANTFSDSISVLDLKTSKIVATIPLGTEPKLSAEQRGEILFHDARLSFESWLSCHSCHTDGHSNGRLNDNLSDGSFGTPKRVLSLLGAKASGPWAWNGKVDSLEFQAKNSIQSTMKGKTPTEDQVKDLAAYLRSLAPAPSLAEARHEKKSEAFERGKEIFAQQKCATCHAPPTFTTAKTYDVGVHDELGGTRFNPPSLLGVSQGGPYFHDNRAATLEEVFTRHRHQLREPLSPASVHDLVEFLKNQ